MQIQMQVNDCDLSEGAPGCYVQFSFLAVFVLFLYVFIFKVFFMVLF